MHACTAKQNCHAEIDSTLDFYNYRMYKFQNTQKGPPNKGGYQRK